MAESVKCLHEDTGLDPQTSMQKSRRKAYTYNPSNSEMRERDGDPWKPQVN